MRRGLRSGDSTGGHGPATVQDAGAGHGVGPTVGLAYPWLRLAIGLGVLAVVAVVASASGTVGIPPRATLEILASRLPGVELAGAWPETWETILLQLRLPRVALAGTVGAALALSGAMYQGLFRNPLADPYLIGVASGAGLGATIVLLSGATTMYFGLSILPLAAFAGAIAAVAIAYVVAHNSEGLPLANMILAGVAVAALAGAVTTLLMLRSDPDLRPVLSWLLGGFISAKWEQTLMDASLFGAVRRCSPRLRSGAERAAAGRGLRTPAGGEHGGHQIGPGVRGHARDGRGGLVQRANRVRWPGCPARGPAGLGSGLSLAGTHGRDRGGRVPDRRRPCGTDCGRPCRAPGGGRDRVLRRAVLHLSVEATPQGTDVILRLAPGRDADA